MSADIIAFPAERVDDRTPYLVILNALLDLYDLGREDAIAWLADKAVAMLPPKRKN